MQHLVEEDVFDGVARHARVVKDAADDDGVMRRVVVAEAAAGVGLAPGKLRSSHEPVKEAAVEVVEDFFEMIVVSAGGADLLASSHLADEAGFGGHVMTGDIAAITGAVGAIDRLAIKLGEQDVSDRVEHRVGSAFEQVGEPDVKLSLAQADGVVDGDKGIETNMKRRRGRMGTKFAIGCVEDFGKLWGHVEGRLARGGGQQSALSIQHSENLRGLLNADCCVGLTLFLLFFLLHVFFDLGGGFAMVVGAGVDGVQGVGQQEFVLAGFGGCGVRGVL